jgi:sugar phosphate isomerase/epimerase
MLLTLHAASLEPILAPSRGKPSLTLQDLPRFARQELDMHGLNLPTTLLKGATRSLLEGLRERADKERCACLVLIEPEPLALADESDVVGGAGVERAKKVLNAASLLGCSAVAVRVNSRDEDDFVDFAADRFRQIVETADRLDINVLVQPHRGLTERPERLTELIKKIGGFRVGTMPDFADAVSSADPGSYLRKLVPYASIVCATTQDLVPPEMPPEEETDEPQAPVLPSRRHRRAMEAAAEAREEESLDEAELSEEVEGDEAGASAPRGLAGLLNAVLNAEPLEEDPPPPVHSAYELQPLIDAVSAVGFDGSLAVRFAGRGDCVVGTDLSRWALEHAVQHRVG